MYSALFEDEDDIFGGSPRSKFFDVIYNANRDLCKVELEKLVYRLAALELLAQEHYGDDVDAKVNELRHTKASELDTEAKNIYIEFVGDIVSQE